MALEEESREAGGGDCTFAGDVQGRLAGGSDDGSSEDARERLRGERSPFGCFFSRPWKILEGQAMTPEMGPTGRCIQKTLLKEIRHHQCLRPRNRRGAGADGLDRRLK